MKKKKSLTRIVGGRGTMADPFQVRNDLELLLHHIPEGGYDYEPYRIAEARKMLKEAEMSGKTRKDYEYRIAVKEYRSKGARPGYLRSRAYQEYGPLRQAIKEGQSQAIIRRLTQKCKDFFEAAERAYEEFLAFAKAHPDLKKEHERWNKIYFMSLEEKLKKRYGLIKQQLLKHDR